MDAENSNVTTHLEHLPRHSIMQDELIHQIGHKQYDGKKPLRHDDDLRRQTEESKVMDQLGIKEDSRKG